MYMLGYFVASPVSGYLSDKYGRKIMLRLGYVGFLLLDLMSAWLPLLSTILVSRFFLGCLHAVCASVSFVLMIEVMEPKMRTVAGIAEGNFWAASIMLYGGLAYFIRDWRILQTAVTLPALLILPVLCFIDESPRWLFINGKPQEALLVLGKMAQWHNVEVPPEAAMTELVDELQETRASTTQQQLSLWVLFKSIIHGALMLFRTPRLRIITLFIYVDFLMVGMVYFGLSLSGTNISENPFVYMVLSGVMEVPAYSLTIPIVHRYGRKRTLSVLFVISGIILLCLAFSSAAKSTVAVTLALMGKVTITGSFQIAIIFSGELFPTEVRSRGVSTSCMMSRLGGIVAPFITDVVGTVYPWAPFFVFGLGALVAGAGTLLLPETSNQKMPETVGQLESREPLRRKLRSAPV
ncbi:organic cation transporter protein-like [Scylla paramamosain]|uniref:organic cation transporter protein-like n=1 Tax=Scylla paramamosain TaxID=85552 RepID=UPI003082C908